MLLDDITRSLNLFFQDVWICFIGASNGSLLDTHVFISCMIESSKGSKGSLVEANGLQTDEPIVRYKRSKALFCECSVPTLDSSLTQCTCVCFVEFFFPLKSSKHIGRAYR